VLLGGLLLGLGNGASDVSRNAVGGGGEGPVTRSGHRVVVRGGALFSAVGYTVTAFITSLPLVLIGWALVGFGVAMIGPQVYAAARHLGGGWMLAVVVTFGQAAFLSGPAILGWLVHSVGVQHAMLLPLVLAFACRVLALRGVA